MRAVALVLLFVAAISANAETLRASVQSALDESRRKHHRHKKGIVPPSKEELRKHYRKRHHRRHARVDPAGSDDVEPSGYVNWVDSGFATPVKNQGNCNDCYAVSGFDMWSAKCNMDTGELFDLSAQFGLDCGLKTCEPAPISRVLLMHQVIANSSLPTYDEMPLTAAQNLNDSGPLDNPPAACPITPPPEACIGNSVTVQMESHVANARLRSIVSTYGPAQVMINFPGDSADSYKCGVYTEEQWPQQQRRVDHAVLIVGYNYTGDDATSYWIAKNSYGTEYGFQGYFAVSMDGPQADDPPEDADFPGTMSINTYVFWLEDGNVKLAPNPPANAVPENPFASASILCG